MSNNTKIIIGIVIVLIVAALAYLFFGQMSPVQAPTSNGQDDMSSSVPAQTPTGGLPSKTDVSYTNNGFTPNTVTIKKGTAVVFTNTSSKKMWVASSMHPSHKDYPEAGGCYNTDFDPSCGLDVGESFSFIYNIVGTWHYHNHLSASDYGTVIVTE